MSRYNLFFLPIAYSVIGSVTFSEMAPVPPNSERAVRDLLNGVEFKGERRQLIWMGERAFPSFEAILLDPIAKPDEVARVLLVLRDVKADRRKFIEHAVRRLADSNDGVRWFAVQLLEQIGTTGEASPVIALLSDKEKVVVYAAAKALTTIGGPREVVAMDAWLRGVSHRDDTHLRQHVKQCRDSLKERLDKAAKKAR